MSIFMSLIILPQLDFNYFVNKHLLSFNELLSLRKAGRVLWGQAFYCSYLREKWKLQISCFRMQKSKMIKILEN